MSEVPWAQPARPAQPAIGGVRASGTRARWAMVLVGITTGAIVIELLIALQGLGLIAEDATPSRAELVAWSKAVDGAVALYVFSLFASAIGFVAWQSRVVDNIPGLTGGRPLATPRMSIVWWFVPFASFVQPYRIMADAWRRLARTPAETSVTFVSVWWLLWVGGLIGDRLVAALPVDTLAEIRTLISLDAIVLAALVTSGILLILIIREIERRARSRAAAIAAGDLAPVLSGAVAGAVAPWGQPASVPATQDVPAGWGQPSPPIMPVVAAVPSPMPGPVAAGSSVVAVPVHVMFCPDCGTARVAQTRFCGSCGYDLATLARS